MDYVGLILNLADNIVELIADHNKTRHAEALMELRKRYENEKNKDQTDFNLLDTIELDIMRYCELLSFTIRKSPSSDMRK